MCTVLLPPGDNPIAVNKYINFNLSYKALYLPLPQESTLVPTFTPGKHPDSHLYPRKAPWFPPLPQESTLVPIEYEAGWALEMVRIVLEMRKSLVPAGIRTPDHSAHS